MALHGVLGFASAPLEDGAQLQLQVIMHVAKRDVFKSVVRSQLEYQLWMRVNCYSRGTS